MEERVNERMGRVEGRRGNADGGMGVRVSE